MNNGQMVIIHRPCPITSLNIPPDIIVNTDVNAAYRAFPQIYVVPTRGCKSAVICSAEGSLEFNVFRPTRNPERARQTLVLSSYSLAKWQHGYCATFDNGY